MFDDPADTGSSARSGAGLLLRRAGLSEASPAALAGVAVLVLLALVFAGWRVGALFIGEGEPGITFEAGESGAASPPGHTSDDPSGDEHGGGEAAEAPASVWVHVAGAVARPGLFELPFGSRVGDALTAAGGPGEDGALDAVNLARLLADGEQVYVPSTAEVEAGTAPPSAATDHGGSPAEGPGNGLVDLNTASETELVALPGVGPATAGKIVADREANGPFTSPEEIMRVSGIGEKKFEALRDLIVVK